MTKNGQECDAKILAYDFLVLHTSITPIDTVFIIIIRVVMRFFFIGVR